MGLLVTPQRKVLVGGKSTVVTAASKDIMSVDAFKVFINKKSTQQIGTTIDARFLEDIIKAAQSQMERFLGRVFITQTRRVMLDEFTTYETEDSNVRTLALPDPPLSSVSSITLIDSDGNPTIVDASSYQVDTTSEPGRIYFLEGVTGNIRSFRGIQIDYIAGYGDPDDVDPEIVFATKALAKILFETRGPVNPKNAKVQNIYDSVKHLKVT